ncbi:hypothetical protein [Acetobacter sp. P1H12_c]|uniref:hypothetical protein n=1 Tax=Acetobacter sp. P1H12_c TaxID=2762621 RepID=UPI001C046AED|nr:hypothetical protein [Acetobacter sp. P1H12_c]
MTTPTNWPNPERPGHPSWPEYYGEHVLIERRTGNKVPGIWNSPYAEWILQNGSFEAKNAANYYIYSHCVSLGPDPTPAPTAEMLAAERERCAKLCEEAYEKSGRDFEYLGCNDAASQIRNLGDAP